MLNGSPAMMRYLRARLLLVGGVAAAAASAGCVNGLHSAPPPGEAPVPEPLRLLLPKKIRIHPFTGTRVFSEQGGIAGIDVRIEAIDGFGDATKAFGSFRFELLKHEKNVKGDRLAVWTEDLTTEKANRAHWDGITRAYQFKLAWRRAVPLGEKFVLVAVFDSPYTPRLFDERTFVSGQ